MANAMGAKKETGEIEKMPTQMEKGEERRSPSVRQQMQCMKWVKKSKKTFPYVQ